MPEGPEFLTLAKILISASFAAVTTFPGHWCDNGKEDPQ